MSMMPIVDWTASVAPGRDAEDSGACTVFALAHWLEATTGSRPDDESIIAAYQAERIKRHPDGKGTRLTMPEGFAAAYNAGWITPGTTICRTNDITLLREQPLLVAYIVNHMWASTGLDGLVSRMGYNVGTHMVCLLGYDGEYLTFANSWGREWGSHGFGRISLGNHFFSQTEMWEINQKKEQS